MMNMKRILAVLFASIISALIFWSAVYLISTGSLPGLGVTLIILMILIDYFILNPKAYPYRYTIPALILLFILVLYPIYFTIKTAFTNYGTGHMGTRKEVIQTLLTDPSYTYKLEEFPTYHYSIYISKEDFLVIFKKGSEIYYSSPPKPYVTQGRLVLLRRGKLKKAENLSFVPNMENARYLILNGKTYKKFYDPDDPTLQINEGVFKRKIAQEYLFRAEFVTPENELIALRLSYDGKWRFFRIAHLYRLGFKEYYDDGKILAKEVIINTKTGKELIEENGTFYDTIDGKKVFVAGYISYVGWKNFERIIKDPNVAGPFFQIFWWTFTWAALSVLFTFVIGLGFALLLNDKNLKGRTIYRTLLIIPWAVPAFISVLVWKNGMFNETYGIINRFLLRGLFGLEGVKWFNDPFWAKVAVLTVNTWLGFPYMMTVCLGALQSIPDELYEAAQIDGAGKFARFRKITFPLLMTTVAPLLVGSFAFNFNNFVNIYLLTGGGPPIPGTTTPAGSTDILISYTYKLAFEGGRGQDFGFASAVSIIIFFIVAGISVVNFKLSGSFEEELK